MRKVVKTAGKPYAVKLEAERANITADGEDVCYLRAYIVDRDGNLCPTASNKIKFSSIGAGRVYGTDNGDPRETDGFFIPERKALNGICAAAVISNKGEIGKVSVVAKSEGLLSDSAVIEVKNESCVGYTIKL
jgi:beta-galactosidase